MCSQGPWDQSSSTGLRTSPVKYLTCGRPCTWSRAFSWFPEWIRIRDRGSVMAELGSLNVQCRWRVVLDAQTSDQRPGFATIANGVFLFSSSSVLLMLVVILIIAAIVAFKCRRCSISTRGFWRVVVLVPMRNGLLQRRPGFGLIRVLRSVWRISRFGCRGLARSETWDRDGIEDREGREDVWARWSSKKAREKRRGQTPKGDEKE